MGNNFSSDANIFNEYFIYTLYTTTSLLSLTAIFMQWRTQGFKNKSLLLLLICILFYSVDYWVYNYLEYNGSLPSAALLNGSEAICHWIITYTYIKVAYQTNQLLDPLVYFDDQEKIEQASKFNRNLKVTNAVVVFLIIALSVLIQIGYQFEATDETTGGLIFWVGNYGTVSLEAIFTIAWGVVLINLLRKVKTNPNLLPNKNMFIQHWFYLCAFVVLYLLTVIGY